MAKDTAPTEYVEALKARGFTLDDKVGGGAFGVVYKATQNSLKRPVAVKFLRPNMNGIAEHRQRFEREGELLARVPHPSIPYVITTGEVKKVEPLPIPYIVMQFVEGRTVDKLLKPLPSMDLVYRVMHATLSALQCAHKEEVIHRDVKPDNVIVGTEGIYLLDFSMGIGPPNPELARATRPGAGVGHTHYAAPEQMRNAATADARSDIYSAGALLAEMLGVRPRVKLATLDAEIPGVPQALREVVRKAVADSPDQRFQSAFDFLTALEILIGPTRTEILEPAVVLCPGHHCRGAHWSVSGFLLGARTTTNVTDRNCAMCGSVYIRGCPHCQRPLPANVADLVVRGKKSDNVRVPPALHCVACGTLIYRVPTCQQCRSFLKWDDIEADTKDHGCQRCRKAKEITGYGYGGGGDVPAAGAPDDDIPF